MTIQLYVMDVDALAGQAVAAGAKLLKPVEDQFYGDRAGNLEDPFGHIWWIATHKEDISPEVEELNRPPRPESEKRVQALTFGRSRRRR